MTKWWEAETLARFIMQERRDEAQTRRLIREAQAPRECGGAFLGRMGAWLSMHVFTRIRKQQGQSCAGSRIEESTQPRPGSLIL